MFDFAQSGHWGHEVVFLREAAMDATQDDYERRIALPDVIPNTDNIRIGKTAYIRLFSKKTAKIGITLLCWS